jgi:hypothetical protein
MCIAEYHWLMVCTVHLKKEGMLLLLLMRSWQWSLLPPTLLMLPWQPYDSFNPAQVLPSCTVHAVCRGTNLDGAAAARAVLAEAAVAGGRVVAFFCESIISCGGQVSRQVWKHGHATRLVFLPSSVRGFPSYRPPSDTFTHQVALWNPGGCCVVGPSMAPFLICKALCCHCAAEFQQQTYIKLVARWLGPCERSSEQDSDWHSQTRRCAAALPPPIGLLH